MATGLVVNEGEFGPPHMRRTLVMSEYSRLEYSGERWRVTARWPESRLPPHACKTHDWQGYL